MNCGFLVTGEVTGKAKNITTPSGDIISTSPGLKITLTGPNGKPLKLVITGVLFFSFPSENVVEVRATGNNLLQLPSPDGLVLTRGNVNFSVDSDGNELRRFSGAGTATNICSLLGP
ncbi:hypothetical protein [Arthrobacter sp. UNC362MFTsu5.1]|jgi:hypothetical protein|nr:hypothetical protein [Arthrobacter sp. UNC362MFTsu5.1]